MNMKKVIAKLESVYLEKPHRVFSMYLNTDPSDLSKEWKIHLKNGLTNFERYMEADGNHEEKNNFKKIKEKVQQYIQENELNLSKSIVVFATPNEEIWFAERLQIPVETNFYWQETAEVGQLKQLNQQFPKTGIILLQKEAIKVIDTELGSLLDTKFYALELETDDWKECTSLEDIQKSVELGGRNMKPDNLEHRFEANRYRMYKTLASKLDKLAKDKRWDSIYLVGDKKEAQDLMNNMNKSVTDIVHKNMLYHKETKVLDMVMAK